MNLNVKNNFFHLSLFTDFLVYFSYQIVPYLFELGRFKVGETEITSESVKDASFNIKFCISNLDIQCYFRWATWFIQFCMYVMFVPLNCDYVFVCAFVCICPEYF